MGVGVPTGIPEIQSGWPRWGLLVLDTRPTTGVVVYVRTSNTQCKIFDFIVGVLALSHPVQLELISI
jgi:hypothetical protein